ncbi:MAG: ABC transporter permease [Firmicutes bacterium]|nr:ABC transporter permease [Bacillota bacterium]
MLNMAKRIIKQILRDKRSLAMILIVPLLLLSLLFLLLGKSAYVPVVATESLPAPFVEALQNQKAIRVIQKEGSETAEAYLKSGKADAVLSIDADGMHILFKEMDSVKMSAVTDAVKSAAASINPQGQMNVEFVYGKQGESLFDSLGFLLLGILSFFMIFLLSGMSFVRERTSDTVERLMLTPVKTPSVVGGYALGFGVFAVIQSVLMILFAKFVLQMPFIGEWWTAMLIMLLLAVVAVMFGVLVSAVSKSEFQVMQFVPLVIIPQIFFSGLIPVETLPYHLNFISYLMPLYYGCTGLKNVLVYGYSMLQVWPQILILCGFAAALFVLNIFAVKKYRAA